MLATGEALSLLAVAMTVYIIANKWIFKLRQRIFAVFMNYIGTLANKGVNALKVKPDHVTPLRDVVSADPELRKRKQMRIVEFGVGGGQNLTDYPQGSQLILVDINGKFESILNEKIEKLPGIQLEKFYVTDAADMHEIPDGSVDAVVSQYALCSCDKVASVLAEVKRILAPGGKYYFIEHVINKNSLWRRVLQKFLVNTGIWGYIFLGCNAAKDTGFMLREAGFTTLNMKEFDLFKFNFIFMVSGSGIYGTATK